VKFGDWETLKELGSGHFAKVYLVQRPASPGSSIMQVGALKALHSAAEGVSRSTMKNEVGRLALLEHPNLSRFIEGNETPEGEQWFVMHFVEGVGLNKRIGDQGTLDHDEWVSFVRVMLDALVYLRQMNLSHLDIKPDNIIRANSGLFTLVDFGLSSKIYGDGQGMTNNGWASPEQLGLVAGFEIPACDVFSMANALYFARTGRNPWINQRFSDYRESIKRGTPDLSGIEQKYRLWLEPALSKHQENRPSAEDLLREFNDIVEGEVPSAVGSGNPKTWFELREYLQIELESRLNFDVKVETAKYGNWLFSCDVDLTTGDQLYLSSVDVPGRALSPTQRTALHNLGWRKSTDNAQILILQIASPDLIVEGIMKALQSGLGVGIENLRVSL
jgi:serine/threonine protein kinase